MNSGKKPVLKLSTSNQQLAVTVAARSFAFLVRATPLQVAVLQFNFREGLLLEQLNIYPHRSRLCLVDPESAHVHSTQRIVPYSSDHNAVQLSVSQRQERIASGIGMFLVAVGKDICLPDSGIDYQKPGSRSKMAVNRAIHTFARHDGET